MQTLTRVTYSGSGSGADPSAAALGPAIHHVHLKDTQLFDDELALTGVLDPRPWDDPHRRSWVFRTIGKGHPSSFWKAFVDVLREAGYDDVLSIENEDPLLPGTEGVAEAAEFMGEIVGNLRVTNEGWANGRSK